MPPFTKFPSRFCLLPLIQATLHSLARHDVFRTDTENFVDIDTPLYQQILEFCDMIVVEHSHGRTRDINTFQWHLNDACH